MGSKQSGLVGMESTSKNKPRKPEEVKKYGPFRRLLKALLWLCAGLLLMAVIALIAIYLYLAHDVPTAAEMRKGCLAVEAEISKGSNRPLPLAEIPPMVQKAFLAAEDSNFYDSEYGQSALKKFMSYYKRTGTNRIVHGGSPIVHQVTRQCMPGDWWANDYNTKTKRDLKMLVLAWRIETGLNNDEIMQIFLNSIYLGRKAYGVEAAARTYYGKPIAEVSPAEAAQLASLSRRPDMGDPLIRPKQAEERKLYVLKRLFQLGSISEEQYQTAKEEKITFKQMSSHQSD